MPVNWIFLSIVLHVHLDWFLLIVRLINLSILSNPELDLRGVWHSLFTPFDWSTIGSML